MTHQYRITTQNLNYSSPDDCLLSEDDPIHDFKKTQLMGGLGAEAALAAYNNKTYENIRNQCDNTFRKEYGITREEAIAQGWRPGSPAWNALFQPHERFNKKQEKSKPPTKPDVFKISDARKE